MLGATTISVVASRPTGRSRRDRANDVRVQPVAPARSVTTRASCSSLPEPPQPPSPQRFPVAMVIAPVALAAVLYLFTQNILSILFFALSPVLIVGSWFENRSASKKQVIADTSRFRQRPRGSRGPARLRARRWNGSAVATSIPSVIELIEAVEARSPLVWTRRPEHESFGRVRLGSGHAALPQLRGDAVVEHDLPRALARAHRHRRAVRRRTGRARRRGPAVVRQRRGRWSGGHRRAGHAGASRPVRRAPLAG